MSIFDWNVTPGSNTSLDGINIAEGMPPGNVNNAMRAMMAATKQWQLDMSGDRITGGSGQNFTFTARQSFSAYALGMRFLVRLNRDITSPAQININGRGQASLLVYRGGQALPPIAGEFKQGGLIDIAYSTERSAFIILNKAIVAPEDVTLPSAGIVGRASSGSGEARTLGLGRGVQFSGTSVEISDPGLGLSRTSSGSYQLGLPSSITHDSINSRTDTSHTHEITWQTIGLLIAQIPTGQIGSSALLGRATNNTQIDPGTAVAGSSLRYAGIAGFGSALDRIRITLGNAPSGTWRAMGVLPVTEGGGGDPARAVVTHFTRIS